MREVQTITERRHTSHDTLTELHYTLLPRNPDHHYSGPPGVAVSTAWAPVTSSVNTKRSDAGERHLADFREIVLATKVKRSLTDFDEN